MCQDERATVLHSRRRQPCEETRRILKRDVLRCSAVESIADVRGRGREEGLTKLTLRELRKTSEDHFK